MRPLEPGRDVIAVGGEWGSFGDSTPRIGWYALTLALVSTVILLRHARSAANGSGTLAGRAPGVGLDSTGSAQAAGLVERLGAVPLRAIVTSPLQRCLETVSDLAAHRGVRPAVEQDLSEVDYGEWTGRRIQELAEEPLWKVVQHHPSAAVFPGGEGLAGVQARAVAAVRAHDARLSAEHGERAVWLLCSHGDVIKSVLADALGLHLDGFQRIAVEPCSISVVRYTDVRPFLLKSNDTGSDLRDIVPPKDERCASDAVVGGGGGVTHAE